MRARLTLGLAFACVLAIGCKSLPNDPAQAGLYVDLRKNVELSESTGWVIDRVETEEHADTILRSVCSVDPIVRDALEAWLNGQLTLEGGSAEAQYRANGGDLGAVEAALNIERVRMWLRYGQAHAAEDCPFWLSAKPDFRGIEGDADRFMLLVESIGGGSVVLQGNDAALGGGGGGRVLAGHGFGQRLTLAMGAEVGGNGAFVNNSAGKRSIETQFTAAAPLLLRFWDMSRIYDVELAPVFTVGGERSISTPGMRAAFAAGFSAMRSRVFMPYVMLWLGYEIQPAESGGAPSHSIRIGTRVGVDWDP